MVLRFYLFFFLFAWLAAAGTGAAPTPGPSSPASSATLTGPQWEKVIADFESSVSALSQWLENARSQLRQLQSEIEGLERKIAKLRQGPSENINVLDEIRLKGLLNDLKDKLEKKSDLQHQWDEKQGEFEQKALSLVSLYNDRINFVLANADLTADTVRLPSEVNNLAGLIQKRNHIQTLVKQYQAKPEGEPSVETSPLESLKSGDRESLLLALDLIRDRKKDEEEQLEKWSIEEEEIRNELKLQGKMQEFLEGIQRMNDDSSFPHGSLKRNDLEDVAGKKEKAKLEARQNELRGLIARAQAALTQLDGLMAQVQDKLNASKGGVKQ